MKPTPLPAKTKLALGIADPKCERLPKTGLAKKRTFNGSSKLRDGQRGSRRLCSVWIGWGRLKKRLAFTPKRKSKNWRNGNFGSIIRSSPSQKTNDADENHRPHRYSIGGPRGQTGDLGFNTSRRDGAFRCQRRFPEDRGPLVVTSGLKSSR